MTDIKKRTWRLYPLLAPQLEALGIAHCSRNEQRQISCNNQNDKKTRVNTNIYSI